MKSNKTDDFGLQFILSYPLKVNDPDGTGDKQNGFLL